MYAYLILEHIYTSNINISLPSKLMQWFCNLCCHIHLPDGMLSKMSQPRSINKYSYEVCHIFFSSLCNEWNSFLTSRVLLVMGNDNKQTQTGYKSTSLACIIYSFTIAFALENSSYYCTYENVIFVYVILWHCSNRNELFWLRIKLSTPFSYQRLWETKVL